MAEDLKRADREFQIVKQSSSDIADDEGERTNMPGGQSSSEFRDQNSTLPPAILRRLIFANACVLWSCLACNQLRSVQALDGVFVYTGRLGGVVWCMHSIAARPGVADEPRPTRKN